MTLDNFITLGLSFYCAASAMVASNRSVIVFGIQLAKTLMFGNLEWRALRNSYCANSTFRRVDGNHVRNKDHRYSSII